MIRMVLIAVVIALTVICGSSIVLYQYFGWKGLIALPLIVIAMSWVVKKVIGAAIKKFALGMFGMKSGVLKGATLEVHSITPVAKPVDAEPAEVSDEDEEVELSAEEREEVENERKQIQAAREEIEAEERENPQHYYEVDMTITPHESVDEDAHWEPTEFMLFTERISSLEELADKEAGMVHSVKVWDGAGFGPDEPGKYPGRQRLLVTFQVTPGARSVWINYYNVALGQVELPEPKLQVL